MAKIIDSPLVQLQGKIGNLVFVQSKTWGNHVRAARGSKKAAPVNASLGANANRTAVLNKAAKQVHDMLKIYCGDFKERQLWQKILSRMRQSKTDEFIDLIKELEGLEINDEYPLERFGNVAEAEVNITRQKMDIVFRSSDLPRLKKGIDGYFYELCVLFFAGSKKQVESAIAQSPWIPGKINTHEYRFSFKKPARVGYYILCLKIQGGNNGKVSEVFENMGIRIIKVGKWSVGQ